MSKIVKIKNKILAKNPIAKSRRNKMRKEIENDNPSFLCPNCIGGILFHDLGLKFNSPTVNLSLDQKDFIKFVLNYDEYMSGEFEFFDKKEFSCPCAHLKYEGGEPIVINFTHYETPEIALDKWYKRAERLDKNNLFIFLQERDGVTKEDIMSLKDIDAKGLVVFTANKYEDIPYCVHIPKYEPDGEVGNILKRSYIDDSREYEKYFDFVKWFNEANGKPYNVESFQK